MARENEWDRDRERERDRDRERDQSHDQERSRQDFGGRHEGGYGERRSYDIGRSNEPGSHAGWGGQGFNQGSFGQYGTRGERSFMPSTGVTWGAERESGGGMGTYSGQDRSQHAGGGLGNYNQGQGSERWGSTGGYGQGSEGWRDRSRSDEWNRQGSGDRDRQEYGRDWGGQGFSGREGGWGGYGSYDRERGQNREWDRGRNEWSDRDREQRGQSGNWSSGSSGAGYYGQNQGNWQRDQQTYNRSQQGWAGGQQTRPGEGSQQRGQHFGRGPKGWQRSDERIREEINERLTDHPDVDASDIDVEVKNGEVTLKGTVDSRDSKRTAEDIAYGVSGVRDVHVQLRVNRGFWDKVKDTFTGGSDDDRDRDRDRDRTQNQRDASGQAQHTTGDILSTTPTHTVTPSPQTTSGKDQPVGNRK